MLISTTRPSYAVGCLILGFGFWTVLQLGRFSTSDLKAIRAIETVQQHERISETYTIIRSLSTRDGNYFSIEMGGEPAMNPNMIPHPLLDDAWILVAQLRQDTQYFTELVCTARFHKDALRCESIPSKLPIAPTFGDNCAGDLAYISLNQGPHDARVFHGPRVPYTIYGSNSGHTCFGQWVQDFRNLVDWSSMLDETIDDFFLPTELQRPAPWGAIEKNWFMFWDIDGEAYIHHDLVPNRVFARVDSSGAVGPDMAAIVQIEDGQCMSKHMPAINPEFESIHQATNSLSLTMCRRDDISCIPDISNTFIFTIFQHKKYYNFHAVYEPYIVMFEQVPPFKLHAISTKPFWISGRKIQAVESSPLDSSANAENLLVNSTIPVEQMLYVTSISWKDKRQKYHGYMDDVLFIAFGIEDEDTAAIDVTVSGLMSALGFC